MWKQFNGGVNKNTDVNLIQSNFWGHHAMQSFYQSHGHSVQSDAKTGDMRKYYRPLNVEQNSAEKNLILIAVLFPLRQKMNFGLNFTIKFL